MSDHEFELTDEAEFEDVVDTEPTTEAVDVLGTPIGDVIARARGGVVTGVMWQTATGFLHDDIGHDDEGFGF